VSPPEPAPAALGRAAAELRDRLRDRTIDVQNSPRLAPAPASSAVCLREGAVLECATWPRAEDIRPGDLWCVRVDAGATGAAAFAAWLGAQACTVPHAWSLAPWSGSAAGLAVAQAVAAARLALPTTTRVVARHDLLGAHLAQISVGFGADVLAGPAEPDRSLPLAGVPRPAEGTRAALHALVVELGLVPRDVPGD
jgi:hypothetical protein